jgi:hypothetical protein
MCRTGLPFGNGSLLVLDTPSSAAIRLVQVQILDDRGGAQLLRPVLGAQTQTHARQEQTSDDHGDDSPHTGRSGRHGRDEDGCGVRARHRLVSVLPYSM